MLIITYTCTHNHPGPDFSPKLKQDQEKIDPTPTQPTLPKQEQEHENEPEAETILTPEDSTPAGNVEDSLPYSEYPFNSITANHQEDNPCDFQEKKEAQSLLCGGEDQKSSFSRDHMEMLKQEENDFYDELEELPTSSFFTAFMRNSFCGERVIANPS